MELAAASLILRAGPAQHVVLITSVLAQSSSMMDLRLPNRPCSQVPHNGQHLSCCTVVRGMQRNLFVVPREQVGSEEIAELEAAATTDPAAKKKLIPLLHVSREGRRGV